MKLPADLSPSDIIAVIDSREQTPLDLSPLRTTIGTLQTGDYSLAGDLGSSCVAIERKSLDDLLACIGRERERFEKEVQRLLAYPCRALVVESTWGIVEMGQWARSKITPNQAMLATMQWLAESLAVCFSRLRAGVGASCDAWRKPSIAIRNQFYPKECRTNVDQNTTYRTSRSRVRHSQRGETEALANGDSRITPRDA